MYCLHCGEEVRQKEPPDASMLMPLITHCHWCFAPLSFPSCLSILAQCMECGKMLNSPYAGLCMMFETIEGSFLPDLRVGDSHGLCATCADTLRQQWHEVRKQRQKARLVTQAIVQTLTPA